MPVMLAVIMFCVVIGVLSQQVSTRTCVTIAMVATTMTVLYYLVDRAI